MVNIHLRDLSPTFIKLPVSILFDSLDGGLVNIDWRQIGGARFFSSAQLTSLTTMAATAPISATLWLFGSGLIGLIGIIRRKKA